MDVLGFVAGALTTACWLPQLLRTLRTRSARDFSWAYLAVLMVGLAAWTAYGVGRGDVAIIAANAVTLGFIVGLSVLKLAVPGRGAHRPGPSATAGTALGDPAAPG